jgi:hypothetical protein
MTGIGAAETDFAAQGVAATPKQRVTYLIGAGATHAAADAEGAGTGLLMKDLNGPMADRIQKLFQADGYKDDLYLKQLIASATDPRTDYEHLITFLDQSISPRHRHLAAELRRLFEQILREQLRKVETELGHAPLMLYSALLDMYSIDAFPEELAGLITLNYDDYIEQAAMRVWGQAIDLGLNLGPVNYSHGRPMLLKLHGSLDWGDIYPVSRGTTANCSWIPPGITKGKSFYPFNLIWGRAREVLDCDILRIVGCRLGGNDWDLISLLFSSMYTRNSGPPFRIEVIDSPWQGVELAKTFAYLNIASMFDVEPLCERLMAEMFQTPPGRLRDLDDTTREGVMQRSWKGQNWFAEWLRHLKEELLSANVSLTTSGGHFSSLAVG